MRALHFAITIMLSITIVTACKKEEPKVVVPETKQETAYTIPDDYSFNSNGYPMEFHYNVAPHGADTAIGEEGNIPVSLTRISDKELLLKMSFNKVVVDDTLSLDSMIIQTSYNANAQPYVSYKVYAHHIDGEWKGTLHADHSRTTNYISHFEYHLKKDNTTEYVFARMYIPID